MTLTHIAVFCAAALLYNLIPSAGVRRWFLLASSIVAIFWLQPALSIRQLDFVLPTLTVICIWVCWLLVFTGRPFNWEDITTLGAAFGVIVLISATRYLIPELRLTSRPPETPFVVAALLTIGGLVMALRRIIRPSKHLLTIAMLVIAGAFIVLKSEPLAVWLSETLRSWRGQDITLASASDLNWLGFSYVAFRLIHTLRDRQTGLLPELTLREYLIYMIFFPAYTAGPIDRAERFASDLRSLEPITSARVVTGTGRILAGLLKKFVIADTLALISLDAITALQATSAAGLWLMLYAYAFRLFFDFSGYSDIAIGVGILYGINLPENFDRPYLKNNIASFWQSWHITLSSWVRNYVFSPFSRGLLRRDSGIPVTLVLLIANLVTMGVIGLWHGISWTFLIWGIWHGLGLFIHKLWSDRTRKWYISLRTRPRLQRVWTASGVILTFHFVLLGWIWFALPNPEIALNVLRRLFTL